MTNCDLGFIKCGFAACFGDSFDSVDELSVVKWANAAVTDRLK